MELFVKKQGGFTIIELILVIVVLGILAAYAVPKYMGLDRSARVSLVKALEGSLRSGVDMVHGRALIENKLNTTGDTVKLDDGTEIALAKGYPTADKVWDIIESVDGNNFEISSANGTAVFKVKGAVTPDRCSVTYTQVDSENDAPVIIADTAGCAEAVS